MLILNYKEGVNMENRMLIKIDAWLTSVFGITLSYLLTIISELIPQINALFVSLLSLAFFYWRYREAKARALHEEAEYEKYRENGKNS